MLDLSFNNQILFTLKYHHFSLSGGLLSPEIEAYFNLFVAKCAVTSSLINTIHVRFNLIQDVEGGGGGQKGPTPPTSFSPVASTNIGISRQNFLTFSFNPFAIMF